MRDVRVVYDPPGVQDRGNAWSVHAFDALARAVLDAPFEEAVAVLRWAEASELFTPDQAAEVVSSLPNDARRIHEWVDDGYASFTECIAGTRLKLADFTIETQADVNERQAIDFVVNDVVGLEIDGRQFHESTFESDRTKDLAIAVEGRVPIRASYNMVKEIWPRVEAAIVSAITMHRRGGHDARGENGGATRRAACKPIRTRGKRPWRIAPTPRRSEVAAFCAQSADPP